MRILITKNGEYEIKELDEEKSEITKNIKINKYRILSPKLPKLNKKKINQKLLYINKTFYSLSKVSKVNKSKSSKNSMILNNNYNRNEYKIDENELKNVKKILLSKPKYYLNQKFLEKYINMDNSYKEKLDNLSNLLKSKKEKGIEEPKLNLSLSNNKLKMRNNFLDENKNNTNNRFNSFLRNEAVKIGDIISNRNLIDLKSYISKDYKGHNDVRIPLDINNKDSFNFRTKYENKKTIKRNLYNILNLSINSDRTNLIDYFKQNKSISPYYFKNLLNCDNTQIDKLNKICGIVLNKEKKNNVSEDSNKKTIKNEILKKSKNSNELFSLLNNTNKILGSYAHFEDLKKKLKKNEFKEMLKITEKKFWDRFHINNLGKRNKNNNSNFEQNISV